MEAETQKWRIERWLSQNFVGLFLALAGILLQIFSPPGFFPVFAVAVLFVVINVGYFVKCMRTGERFSFYEWSKINLIAIGGAAVFFLVMTGMLGLASIVPQSVAAYFPAILIAGLVSFGLYRLFAFLR